MSRDALKTMAILEKPKRERSAEYLDWLRAQPCVLERHQSWGYGCKGLVEAHHIVKDGHGKVGSKTDDRRALPFCHSHHLEYHALGSASAFECRYPVLLEYEIRKYQTMFQPKLKRKRDKSVGIIQIMVRCRCAEGSHKFAPSKVVHDANGTRWHCPNLRETVTVEFA